MKSFNFKTADFAERELDQGFRLLRELRLFGVPAVGDVWPWAVNVGAIEVTQDALWGTLCYTWAKDYDPAVSDWSASLAINVYALPANDVHKGLFICQALRDAGVPVMGNCWPWCVERGVLVHCGFDAVFGNLIYLWKE